MVEEWKTIKDFDKYEISNLGIIRNKKTKIIRKQSNHKDGYKRIVLFKDNKYYIKSVHRLVALTFIPNPNNYDSVDHINGDKSNNTINNLQWMDKKANWYKYKNSENFEKTAQKQKLTWYTKNLKAKKTIPIKKRCYIYNNIIFFTFDDISKYLNKDKVNTRHFLFQNRILKDFVLLLLNGKIISIEDKTGTICDDLDINTLKFYNQNKDKYIKIKNMQLLRAEHSEHGIWYFTSMSKASKYVKTSSNYIKMQLGGIMKSIKGWTFEWTDDDNIINKYINPEV